jgi:hypothetical protein
MPLMRAQLVAAANVAHMHRAAFSIQIPSRVYQIREVPDAAKWMQEIKKQIDR